MMCSKCGKNKTRKMFYRYGNVLFKTCKECCSKSSSSRYRKNLTLNRRKAKESVEMGRFGDIRKNIIKERCERCGSSEKLCLHHKDWRGRRHPDPNNVYKNLETLCAKCHNAEHHCVLVTDKKIQNLVRKHWDIPNIESAKLIGVSNKTIARIKILIKKSPLARRGPSVEARGKGVKTPGLFRRSLF